MKNGNRGVQAWVKVADWRRIENIASKENRTPKDQLTQLLDEACERRGLDPHTLKPLVQQTVAAAASAAPGAVKPTEAGGNTGSAASSA